VLKTQGAINTVTPSDTHNQQSGLILLGGPSKHYHWNTTQVIDQITELVHAYPDINWQIANSRRSPIDLFKQIENVLPDISLIDVNTVDNHWLPAQLATAGQVWVSPDSVSMVYESLTSGATVGSFILEKKGKKNRVVGGINLLIETNMLTSFDQWQLSHQLTPPPQQLNEAQRAADWILNQ
jgi:mitochondrial fission protein ELM1